MSKEYLKVLLVTLILVSCSDNETSREFYSNILGNDGRSNSYEFVEKFPQQLVNQYVIEDSGGIITPPIFLNDGSTVVGTNDSKVVAIKQRKVIWEKQFDSTRLISNYMASDSNGNIYAVDNQGGIYSIKDSEINWENKLPKESELTVYNGVLATSSGIYFSSSDGILKSFNQKGKLIFEKKFNNSILNPISYTNNNLLIVDSHDEFGKTDTLFSLDSDGNVNWKYYKDGFRILKGVCTNDKSISFGIAKQGGGNPLAMLVNLNLNGNPNWEKEIALLPRHISMSKNGEIYMVTYSRIPGAMQNGVYCYSKNGEVNWNIYYDYSITTPAMITQEQVSFMGSNRKTYGYFYLNRDTGVLEKTITVADAAPINFTANVDTKGLVTFSGSDKLRLVKIDETPMEKILPY